MTAGELAKMVNAERDFHADLRVIPLEGWRRDFWFDQTELPWTNPSPNMRGLAGAILYPGVGLLESAVSVGRGTETPFEIVGAPYVEDVKLAAELNRAGLPGVRFNPDRWRRDFWFDQTELPWTNPSPNMRGLAGAILYPGVGLLESAVSVGRGTETPFEIVGAPYVEDVKLAAELNRAGLPGVRFIPVRFTPAASMFKDQPCGGAYLAVTDRQALNPVDVGITLALALQ